MSEALAPSMELPDTLRQRLERVAAARGEPVSAMVQTVLSRFLDDAERRAPDQPAVLSRLRDLEPSLRSQDVAAMWLFGSIARGEATPDSDVDFAIDYAPDAKRSLFDLFHLKDELEAALGRKVDLGERVAMRPWIAAEIERDLLRVF